jgi:Fe-S cluster biosynthesis and repair protein YggX
MAIHRFKCSNVLNKEIMEFSDIHKFDSKENLIEQYESWIKQTRICELIQKEEEFLQVNSYDGDIHMKIFKSIKYYYIKKFIDPEENMEKKEKKEKKKPTYFPKEFLKKIYEDIEYNFETNRLFKPADSYILFLEKNDLKDSSSIKKCYKNIYYQIKNKKYYVNDR